jgi:RNA polymerase sigma-70 factor (ECF subfamily)
MDEQINKNLSERALQDYEYVKLAVEGDQKAYTFLMERYQNAIYHMMFRMIGNKEDSDDLTQEAFGKAFNKLSTYAPRYAFSTWLFKIASNNCIDHIRKKRLVLLSIDETIENEGGQSFSNNLKSNSLDPEQKFIQQQRIKLIRSLMGQLSEKYRLMIELRFFEELSYEEIADELEIPLGTVKAQLFRAKEILYSLMQTPEAKAHVDWKRKKK